MFKSETDREIMGTEFSVKRLKLSFLVDGVRTACILLLKSRTIKLGFTVSAPV